MTAEEQTTTEQTEIPQQPEETTELPPCAEPQTQEEFNFASRENLAHKVGYLAKLRQAADDSKNLVDKVQAQIGLLIEVSLLGQKLDAFQKMLRLDRVLLAAQDEDVRKLAVAIFRAEGEKDKHPHPDVSISVRQDVQYDLDVAKTYAMEHYPGALKLDRRAFDKIAKATPHKFVTITGKPGAKISRDLSEYLPEETEDEGIQDQDGGSTPTA